MYLSFNLQPFGMMDVIHEFENPPKVPLPHARGGAAPPPSACANALGGCPTPPKLMRQLLGGGGFGLDAPPLRAFCVGAALEIPAVVLGQSPEEI